MALSPPPETPKERSFREFQELNFIIQIALARATEEQIEGLVRTERHVTQYIIEMFDDSREETIGDLISEMERFVSDPVRCRMVRCYVDHGCNMVRAKLAWHENY